MPDHVEVRNDGVMTEVAEKVSSERLRDHLGKYLGLVEHGRKMVVVTKNGRDVALLIPLPDMGASPAESTG